MESLQNIQRRIKGVKNINQITKAMELVAATKMRKSQEVALASRAYAFSAIDLLAKLTQLEGFKLPPLLEKRELKKTCVVVITSDKGLAGSFNGSVLREFEKFMKRESIDPNAPEYSFISVGQKAAAYLEKRASNLEERFIKFGDFVKYEEIEPFAKYLIEKYLAGAWDRVIVFSMHFRSALNQQVVRRELFPVDLISIEKTAREVVPETGRFAEMIRDRAIPFFEPDPNLDYIIEPDAERVLEDLVEHLVKTRIYQMVLEANASEHAARRMAMKNASDNASELSSDLTLVYNKARQAIITREIIEIVAGAESLK